MIICYTVLGIWCVIDLIVPFHFGLFFALLLQPSPPNSSKNQNFKKMKKTSGQTNGQKKWHIEVVAPPEKQNPIFQISKSIMAAQNPTNLKPK